MGTNVVANSVVDCYLDRDLVKEKTMGTKNNPGDFDCYANADNDEPMFVLLGRDKQAPKLVRDWAYGRLALVKSGAKPLAHLDKAIEAFRCADDMETWQAGERVNSLKERLRGEERSTSSASLQSFQTKGMPEQISDPSLPIASMRNRRTPAVIDPHETGANVAVPMPRSDAFYSQQSKPRDR